MVKKPNASASTAAVHDPGNHSYGAVRKRLLAVNAAFEAARAGDRGLELGLMAEEVFRDSGGESGKVPKS